MRIVVLSGAGLSAESGLGTFRDEGGVWTRVDLGEVATPEGFARNPSKVHDFYNARRHQAMRARPNAAHRALARLQAETGAMLVTQNVDTLLEAAGARDVIHMHGRIDRAVCGACCARWDAPETMEPLDHCAECGKQATRPDIVWFGEMPRRMDEIEAGLSQADLFAAVGTSGTVYPAAGFVEIARMAGTPTVELTLEPSGAVFDETIAGPATETVPAWVERVLAAPRR